MAPRVAPGAQTHPRTSWVPCLSLLLAGHHQFICPLLSVARAEEIHRLHEDSSQSLDPAAPQRGFGSCSQLHTSSDTRASSSIQGTCCKARNTCSTVAYPTSFQFTLLSWGSGFCGAGRREYPAQPCTSLGEQLLQRFGCLGSKMGVADGWDKASCRCHPRPVPAVAFPGFGGPGCPGVSRWGAGMCT